MSSTEAARSDEERIADLLTTDSGRHKFIHTLMESLGPEGRAWLHSRLLKPVDDEIYKYSAFVSSISVRQGTTAERQALEIASLIRFFEYRKALLNSAIPATRLAKMLGVSRQTIHDRLRGGQLLGVMDNNVLKFPEWQFDAQGPNGIVEGLFDVAAALDCSVFAKISWLSSPNSIFDGARPIDILKKGQIADVVREARAVGVA